MQAVLLHKISPPRFLSPLTALPPLQKVSTPQAKIPRAVSLTKPDNNQVSISTPTTVQAEIDDSTAAFWDYQFLFVSQRSETTAPITLHLVDGAIPSDFPSGTYYLTGPGLFTDDHGSTVHPLDGHGYLRAFEFDGVTGEVKYMAKYVKTDAQVEEHDPQTDTWRFTHRGPFSVLKGGKKFGNTKVMKNVANTSVLKWGGKLLCLWEGGDPYEIESGTLDTIGQFQMMDGCDSFGKNSKDIWDVAAEMLKPILYGIKGDLVILLPFILYYFKMASKSISTWIRGFCTYTGVFKMPPKRLLSHYKLDAPRNRLVTVSCNAEDMLLPRSNFTFYEFDSNFKLLNKQEFNIPDHLMIHDWAFTDTHYILFANRVKLDVLGSMTAVSGLSPMISALSVNPSKPTSPVYLLPRFPNKSVGVRDWRVPVEAPSQMWLLHVGNAFELKDVDGNTEIQIYACSCSYEWFNFQNLFGYNWQSGRLDPSIMNLKESEYQLLPHLVQMSISLDVDGNCQKCSVEPLNQWKNSSDFPIINPTYSGQKTTCIYAATSLGTRRALPHFPFDTVVKLNVLTKSVQTWSVGTRRFIGEPIFVPKGVEEDDGYLLVIEYAVSIQRCYLIILNPKKIGEGDALVARLEVPRHLNFPLGFHGFWDNNTWLTKHHLL